MLVFLTPLVNCRPSTFSLTSLQTLSRLLKGCHRSEFPFKPILRNRLGTVFSERFSLFRGKSAPFAERFGMKLRSSECFSVPRNGSKRNSEVRSAKQMEFRRNESTFSSGQCSAEEFFSENGNPTLLSIRASLCAYFPALLQHGDLNNIKTFAEH
jgi:hypothetical protein